MKGFHIKGCSVWTLPLAFLIKSAAALFFIYLYTHVYGAGELSEDAGAVMTESKILNEVFYESPTDYFQLLIGSGDTEALTEKHLSETNHWDAGNQTLLNDTRNLIRFHSVIHFFSRGGAYIHALIMCFLSLIGVILLVRSVLNYSKLSANRIFWVLLVLPGLLFWSSGLLKEPLMVLGLGMILYGFCGILSLTKKTVYIIAGVIILLLFKSYLLAAVLPAVLFVLTYRLLPRFKVIGGILIPFIILIITLLLFNDFRQKGIHYLSRKQFDFINVACGGLHADTDSNFYYFAPDQYKHLEFTGDSVELISETNALILQHGQMDEPVSVTLKPEGVKWHIYFMNDRCNGYISITPIRDNPARLIKNIPQALINALFRPFPGDPGGWLKYPSMLETLLVFSLLAFAIVRRRHLSVREISFVLAMVVFSLTLAVLIGWITPVAGAIVRYRVPVYIGIALIAFVMIQPTKRIEND